MDDAKPVSNRREARAGLIDLVTLIAMVAVVAAAVLEAGSGLQ